MWGLGFGSVDWDASKGVAVGDGRGEVVDTRFDTTEMREVELSIGRLV